MARIFHVWQVLGLVSLAACSSSSDDDDGSVRATGGVTSSPAGGMGSVGGNSPGTSKPVVMTGGRLGTGGALGNTGGENLGTGGGPVSETTICTCNCGCDIATCNNSETIRTCVDNQTGCDSCGQVCSDLCRSNPACGSYNRASGGCVVR